MPWLPIISMAFAVIAIAAAAYAAGYLACALESSKRRSNPHDNP